MEIESLRHELQELLVQDPEAAFAKMKSLLPTASVRHKDVVMLQARWEELERSVNKGIISAEKADLKRNQIVEGLLDTISDLSTDDFRAGVARSVAVTNPKKWLWPAVGGLAVLGVVAILLLSQKKPDTTDADLAASMPRSASSTETLTDERDGASYRTVRLAGRTWMAENLRFQSPNSACYNGDTLHCTEFGRLYSWQDAIAACPTGWHLPSAAEWKDLALNAGGYQLNVKTPPEIVGNPAQALVALLLGGNSGFDAVTGGYRDQQKFDGMEKFGAYWTSSKAYREYVFAVLFDTWRERQVILEGQEQGWMLSCRCVKN